MDKIFDGFYEEAKKRIVLQMMENGTQDKEIPEWMIHYEAGKHRGKVTVEMRVLTPLVKKWFQWGKGTEKLKVHEILNLIIKAEKEYCGKDLEHLKLQSNINGAISCIGKSLKKLDFSWCDDAKPIQPDPDGDYVKTERFYYARFSVPPWLKKMVDGDIII